MASLLFDEHCVLPNSGDALDDSAIAELWSEVPAWRIVDIDGVSRLQRLFTFEDFAAALEFTNRVGAMAEAENHHPTLITEWGRVSAMWWTHKVDGLHRNDFIAAAKTDRIYADRAEP